MGHSKDHRPDLGQVKVMLGAMDPLGLPIAKEVHPGQSADDTLYVPLIERIQKMLKRKGLLYVGDSKMAALSTRAFLAEAKDYYLIPLPMTGKTKSEMEKWMDAAVSGTQKMEPIVRETELLGSGYEFERTLEAEVGKEHVIWKERVLVSRSLRLAKQQGENLQKRLGEAAEAVRRLTPEPGRGRRQFREEESLRKAVEATLETHDVDGLLQARWECEKKRSTRFVITAVDRNDTEIRKRMDRLGWRSHVTNLPGEKLTIALWLIAYREGWSTERDFHMLKDRPLGIRPLFVRRDDQVTGLTHLLLLALRLLIMLESRVRKELQKTGTVMKGLYEGLPKKATPNPTATLILGAVSYTHLTLPTNREV